MPTASDLEIVAIRVYSCQLPLLQGPYRWSQGEVDSFDSTVVQILTNEGSLHGWGEVTCLGNTYLGASPEGVRASIMSSLGRALMGRNPCEVSRCYEAMDAAMKGAAEAKSALDMALWDILGKVAGLPLVTLIGGRTEKPVPLYRAISQGSPQDMAQSVRENLESLGYKRFQLKLGGRGREGGPEDVEGAEGAGIDVRAIELCARELQGTPGAFLSCDANEGWTTGEALQVLREIRELPFPFIWIEQPCRSLEEVKSLSAALDARPVILDEVVTSLEALAAIGAGRHCQGVNLKLARLGGLTPARACRDLCVSLRIPMTIEDTWGGDISTAAFMHLAQSTPSPLLLGSTDFNNYNATSNVIRGGPVNDGRGFCHANSAPGLGVEVDVGKLTLLGELKLK